MAKILTNTVDNQKMNMQNLYVCIFDSNDILGIQALKGTNKILYYDPVLPIK